MSIEYFHCTIATVNNQKLLVFCDCPTVVDKFQRYELNNYPEYLAETIHSALCHCQLYELHDSVNIVKIPGHIGIIGNDIADLKAKEASRMLLSGNISVGLPQTISFSNACKSQL